MREGGLAPHQQDVGARRAGEQPEHPAQIASLLEQLVRVGRERIARGLAQALADDAHAFQDAREQRVVQRTAGPGLDAHGEGGAKEGARTLTL